LEFFRIFLFWLTCICAGATLLGLSIYLALLYVEILPSPVRLKTRRARDPHPVSRPRVAEENLVLPADTYEESPTGRAALQEGD
jgi:hypothetical protein